MNDLECIVKDGIVDDSFEHPPSGMEHIGDVMTNLDHSIEYDLEEKLKRDGCCGGYPAVNFHGDVWWCEFEEVFKCAIMRYHVHVDTIKGATLKDIMDLASDKYGGE